MNKTETIERKTTMPKHNIHTFEIVYEAAKVRKEKEKEKKRKTKRSEYTHIEIRDVCMKC